MVDIIVKSSYSFSLSEHVFISPLFMKDSLAVIEFMVDRVFFFQHLKNNFPFPSFFLDFRLLKFFLMLVFKRLIMMCFSIDFFALILLGFSQVL